MKETKDHLMLTCRQITEFLDSYIAGELPLFKAAAFRLHLVLCRDCRAYLDSYRRTIHLSKLSMTPDDPPPQTVPTELVQAIQNAMKKP
jgi:hypothetical protein